MPPLLQRKLRFSDVVYAIDTSPKALRNWLQREQVELISERPESGWQQFSMADVALLAIVRQIVAFGVRVENASRMARSILVELQGAEWLEHESDSLGFSMFWSNRAVLIFPSDNEQWRLLIWNMWEPVPADAPAAFIALKPEQVLRSALRRAAEGAEDEDLEWESPETIEAMEKLLAAIRGATPGSEAQ